MALDLLRREWQDGCRAGMTYQTALGSVRRLLEAVASEQLARDLTGVIVDLEAYGTLPREHRTAALTKIATEVRRLIDQLSVHWSPGRSMPTLESSPIPATARARQPEPNAGSRTFSAPGNVRAELYGLSPSEFEMTVASLLRARGFTNVHVIGGANDLGVDISCYDPSGNLAVVQCKRYAPHKTITSPMIQHFMAMALHHGAHGKIYVTTSDYTAPAIALAQDAGVELIDGDALAALVHANRPETHYPEPAVPYATRHPDPNVPVVVPDFYSDRPVNAAEEAECAWLSQFHPETPVITAFHSNLVSTLTEEQQREWRRTRERLLALTPEQFRKACVLSHMALFVERDRPTIRLFENEHASIQDYVIMYREQSLQPSIWRCHHLPASHVVTLAQLEQFIRFARANGWNTGSYCTTGLFTAGALIRAHDFDFGGSALDGWSAAWSLLPEKQGPSKGKDCLALAQQPGWPKLAQISEGTERRGLLRRLFR
jgi:hypothetical protein